MNKPKELKTFKDENNKYALFNELVKIAGNKLKPISVEIGSKFLKIGEFPNGIIIIKEGILSVKLVDEKNNSKFTIDNLRKGEIAGIDQLICLRKDSEIVASTKVKGFYLERKYFLEIINKNVPKSLFKLFNPGFNFLVIELVKETFKKLNNSFEFLISPNKKIETVE